MQFWAIVVDSFRQSRDRKIFWVMLVISVMVAGTMACISFTPGKVSFLFGIWELETDQYTVLDRIRDDLIAAIVIDFVMAIILGWVGVMLTIIATAGFFPAFLEQGFVDVLLSKPLPRWRLFLGKYVGAMVFVFVQAAIFVLLTFVVVGWRWGVWLPGYLWSIPLVVLLFSYLYCISAWVGIKYRSTVASVLITLGAWVLFSGVQNLDDFFVEFPSWQKNVTAHTAIKTARWMVPKTQDIVYLAKRWAGAAVATELIPESEFQDESEVGEGEGRGRSGSSDRQYLERAEAIEKERMAMNPLLTIGSSLLFEAVIVLLAMWSFARRDY